MNIPIARVTQYYASQMVAVVDVLDQSLHVGDKIVVVAKSNTFRQTVEVMKQGISSVDQILSGDTGVLLVQEPVENGDVIYLDSQYE